MPVHSYRTLICVYETNDHETHQVIIREAVRKQKAVVMRHIQRKCHTGVTLKVVIITREEGYKCRGCR